MLLFNKDVGGVQWFPWKVLPSVDCGFSHSAAILSDRPGPCRKGKQSLDWSIFSHGQF